MCFEASLVGIGQHFVRNASGVSHAQHGHASVCQLSRNPIDGRVALCTNQHLRFAAQHLTHGLHQRGGFARARRAMHHQHITGTQHIGHGSGLGSIEPRQMGRQLTAGAPLGFPTYMHNVAQGFQPIVLCR